MKKIFIIFVFIHLYLSCTALEYYPIKIKELYGYIDENGNLIINPCFETASEFNNGLAVVKYNNKYCLIDQTGSIFLETDYKYVSAYSSNGYAQFIDSENNSGYLNQNGNEIMKFPYKNCSVFSNEYATIGPTDNEEYLIINQNGDKIYQLSALSCGLYSEGYFVFEKRIGKKIQKLLFSIKGDIIYPPEDYKIDGTKVFENCIKVRKNGETYIWNVKENHIIKNQKYFIYSKRNNKYIVQDKITNLFGLVDDSFNILITPEYESLVFISDTILAYEENELCGLMDIYGSKITTAKYIEFGKVFDNFIYFNPRNGIDGGLLRLDGKEFNALTYFSETNED